MTGRILDVLGAGIAAIWIRALDALDTRVLQLGNNLSRREDDL